jgi:long-chain acyl-CoA synthetase
MNLADFLTDTSSRKPDHPAIRYEGSRLTFAEMNSKVDALCRGFTRTGIKPGDICVLMMPSSLNWTLVYYALAKMGAVVVPVNFLFRQRELDYILRDSGAKAFIGHCDYLDDAVPVVDSLPDLTIRIADGENPPAGFTPLKELFFGAGEFPTYPTQDDDPFAVIYTSGTTGEPKGAVLTHKSLMSDVIAVANVRHTEAHDIVLSVLPLFHIYGMNHSLNISIYQGLTIRMWSSFDTEKVIAAIAEEESTILYAVPTMVNRLVEAAAENPPRGSSLRFVISGGASLPVEVLHRFENSYNTTIYESYGLTEFSPTCVENPFGRETRPGSIGLPIPPFQTRIVDQNGCRENFEAGDFNSRLIHYVIPGP